MLYLIFNTRIDFLRTTYPIWLVILIMFSIAIVLILIYFFTSFYIIKSKKNKIANSNLNKLKKSIKKEEFINKTEIEILEIKSIINKKDETDEE